MIRTVSHELQASVRPGRVLKLMELGFPLRQAQFLVHVLVFSGVFLERQYRAFTGVAHGQRTHDVLTKLINRGYATEGLTMVRFTDSRVRDTSRADYTRLHVRIGERMRSMGGSLQIATGGAYSGFSDSLRDSDWQIRVMGDRNFGI